MNANPIFSLSFQWTANLFLFMFFGLLAASVWGAASVTAPLLALAAGGLFPVAMGLFFLWGYMRVRRLQVMRAEFYADHFSFSGSQGSKVIQYEEIASLAQRRGTVFWVRETQLLIVLKNEGGPILICKTPKSKSLNTDLYRWLTNRLNERTSMGPSSPPFSAS